MDRDDPLVCLVSGLSRTSGHRYVVSLADGWWVFNPINSSGYPDQGWKLHLSALPGHAPDVLQAVANLLIEQDVRWKVCQDMPRLIDISCVPSSPLQVGKFITIYPRTEEQAVELAALLHCLTAAYSGPVIPTDKRYAPDSQVYYRYGGFTRQEFYHQDTLLKTPYILTPRGEKVHDRRTPGGYCPAWLSDPFPAQEKNIPSLEEARHEETRTGLFGRGLSVSSILRRSAKGGVYGVKTSSGPAVLKEARLGTNPDLQGRDARDRLSNEYEILCKLAPLGIVPRPIELFDAEQNRYLLMERLVGPSLATYVEQRNYLGDEDRAALRKICLSLIHLVQTCHAAGVVIRDLTPSNVLVTSQGCKLVDLELAAMMEDEGVPFLGFTLGYVLPGTERYPRRTVQDDLYALGSVLCFFLTGVPSHLLIRQTRKETLERLLALFLRDDELSDLLALAIEYLSISPTEDIPTPPAGLNVVKTCTSGNPEQSTLALPGVSRTPSGEVLPFTWDLLRENAMAVADDLYQSAAWQSTDRLWAQSALGQLFHPACFHTGASGIAYYLCEVAQASGDATYYAHAARIMDWTLSTHPFQPGESPAGLYFGYAAVPWVLTLIADGLRETRYADRALSLARQIAAAPLRQLDITHGAAGRGLMHLELYRRLGDREQLTRAVELAQYIAEQREERPEGMLTWVNQGKRLWGFAHGSAGLAYYLLLLAKQTGDSQLRALAVKAGYTLLQVAYPTAHGQGRTWSTGPADETTRWTHWCNGASGVGTYFLEAAKVLPQSEFEQMAVLAANTIRLSHPFGACCQCHGLAGEGDYLLQAGRDLARPEIEQAAWKIAQKLFAIRFTRQPWWLWPEETRLQAAPDYMTGYCGVYSFLLRLFRQDLPRPFLPGSALNYAEPIQLVGGGTPL